MNYTKLITKKLINIHLETKSIRRTVRILDTSRFTVRKFVKRYNIESLKFHPSK